VFDRNLAGVVKRKKSVIIGDFHAQVGNDWTGYEEVMGCFGEGMKILTGEMC
jgi:hypothetical protein